MIKDLPPTISSRSLDNFYLGNQEAIRDELLSRCYCEIPPVRRFLQGDKDYLLGVKGSGKSAVFRLLLENKISFENKSKLNQIIVPIDQDIDYLSVKYHLQKSLDSAIEDEDVRARFIWEIYILYRMVTTILSSKLEIDKATRKILSEVSSYFSFTDSSPSIIDIVTRANRTIGCKIDMNEMGFPAPDFYIKSEPNSGSQPKKEVEKITINLGDIQSKINSLLRKNNAIIYVLIDNLDDFLAREAYDAQRLVIQGLLACAKDYSRHQYIKVKLFLRTEVFHKVEFEKIGGSEKIKPNAISLEWGESDIRRFIAERLIYNMLEVFKFSKVEISISDDDLYRRSKRYSWVPKKVWKFFSDKRRKALDITELDQAWREIITCFMPRTVEHYNEKGNLTNGLDLFDYLNSHLCLANSRATPRAVLIYLDKLLQVSTAYYAERLYPKIALNEDGEYPLFLKDHILLAYGLLQDEVKSYISSSVTHPEWKERIASLLTNVDRRRKFSFRELRRLIDYDEKDQDAKELLAFLEHLGVLICYNKSVHLPDRQYEIPLILQKNWTKE